MTEADKLEMHNLLLMNKFVPLSKGKQQPFYISRISRC